MPRLYLFEEWAIFGNCGKNVYGLHVCMLPVCRCCLYCCKNCAISVLATLVIAMCTSFAIWLLHTNVIVAICEWILF